jgi:hypothetical protein
MTEEQALAIFKELDPLDGALRRSHMLGAEDPYEFDVALEGNPLKAIQIIEVIRKANAVGLEVTLEAEGERALLIVDSPMPVLQHPSAPK